MINSLLSAFAMYSRIPVPAPEWKEENRRYSLGFFPLVGTVTGALLYLWSVLCIKFCLDRIIFAAGAVILPLAVNGGIHFDGFCDVTDALSSFGDKEKKLSILSDPHIGSFAVMWAGVYLLTYFALNSEAFYYNDSRFIIITLIFVLSRSLSGICAVTCKSAKKEGTLQSFVKPAHRNITIGMDVSFFILSGGAMIYINAFIGVICIIAAVLTYVICIIKAKKEFGGITGDVLGWALQLCEIICLGAVVFAEKDLGRYI